MATELNSEQENFLAYLIKSHFKYTSVENRGFVEPHRREEFHKHRNVLRRAGYINILGDRYYRIFLEKIPEKVQHLTNKPQNMPLLKVLPR